MTESPAGIEKRVLIEKKEMCPAWEFEAGDLCWFISGTICDGNIHHKNLERKNEALPVLRSYEIHALASKNIKKHESIVNVDIVQNQTARFLYQSSYRPV